MSVPNLIKYILAAVVFFIMLYTVGTERPEDAGGNLFLLGKMIFLSVCLGLFLFPDIIRKIADTAAGLYTSDKGIKQSKDYSRAKAHLVAGRYQQAIEEYKKVLEEDPKDVKAQFEMANIYADYLKDYHRAIDEYNKTLSMNPEDVTWILIQHRLVDIYSRRMNNNRAAINRLEKIIDKFPANHKYSQQAQQRIEILKKNSLTFSHYRKA